MITVYEQEVKICVQKKGRVTNCDVV